MRLDQLARDKRVLVCCGAGGVGKTTTSAALALAAARMGRRALVLTIDPARRLAQSLGIPPTGKEPVQIDPEALAAAGIALHEGGSLHAWMLDPRVVLESVVERFAPSPREAAQIRDMRLYQALGDVISGLQEYTAAEALYQFESEDRFDLIVLDTPPSRNALDFLDAPRRLARFLDERTLFIFAPDPAKRVGTVVRAASKVVQTALAATFGESFTGELRRFLGSFGTLFGKMRVHASGVRKLLRSDRSAFVVIASPEEAARSEALFFKQRIRELGLVTEGFVLNRSYASEASLEPPLEAAARLGLSEAEPLGRALRAMSPLAEVEATRVDRDRSLLTDLQREGAADGGGGAVALPYLDQVVEDLPALKLLSDHILDQTEA